MIQKSTIAESKALIEIAQFMCVAGRTAPKARGLDNIETAVVSGSDLKKLTAKMRYFANNKNKPSFERDADCIDKCPCIVLAGTKTAPAGLAFCSFCGWPSCEKMLEKNGSCVYNALDLGIAIGSMVTLASQFHADNRIMYSAGLTAIKMGMLPEKVKIAVGIPLSSAGKNIFFDRPQK